jgi:hypothetical protein
MEPDLLNRIGALDLGRNGAVDNLHDRAAPLAYAISLGSSVFKYPVLDKGRRLLMRAGRIALTQG